VPEQVVVRRSHSCNLWRMGEHFPAKLPSFPICQVCSVRACIVMSKNDASFHRALVTKRTSQFSGASERNEL
jgi:hypothetical protein